MKVESKSVTLKNGRQVILRSAAPSDAENILRHLRITHAESYKNLNQSVQHWNNFSASDEEKILADFENSAAKFMLVAFYEDRIVGGLGFWGYQAEFVKRSAGIGMSIQKEFCGSGLGTEMMNYTLVQAKQMKFHRIDLTVRTFNEAGIKLYEKVGFERVGLLKDAAFIDGEYVNEYSYQKILG
ncbi:MAG: GNAT family protein [Bdellovibrionota bacterium]